jgi:hypothetical protein
MGFNCSRDNQDSFRYSWTTKTTSLTAGDVDKKLRKEIDKTKGRLG